MQSLHQKFIKMIQDAETNDILEAWIDRALERENEDSD